VVLFRLFINFHRYPLEIIADGEKFNQRAIMCTVANSFRFASAIPIAPQAKLTNNNLVVVVLGSIKRNQLWHYFKSIRAQLHATLPEVTTLSAKQITIKSKIKLNVHADDQIVATTPVTIEAQPKALNVLVDRL
jgi:diacylglycerol kinase (ATP)